MLGRQPSKRESELFLHGAALAYDWKGELVSILQNLLSHFTSALHSCMHTMHKHAHAYAQLQRDEAMLARLKRDQHSKLDVQLMKAAYRRQQNQIIKRESVQQHRAHAQQSPQQQKQRRKKHIFLADELSSPTNRAVGKKLSEDKTVAPMNNTDIDETDAQSSETGGSKYPSRSSSVHDKTVPRRKRVKDFASPKSISPSNIKVVRVTR